MNAAGRAASSRRGCLQRQYSFEADSSRQVVGRFDVSGRTTDGGGVFLREIDRKIGLLKRVARCFSDAPEPQRVEHSLGELLAQRICGLALGYEDLNDREELRNDPALALLARKREVGEPLAGKSTLNRLELTPRGWPLAERCYEIRYSAGAVDALLVDTFLEARCKASEQIVLDLDRTDTLLLGRQEVRFFYGYYGQF